MNIFADFQEKILAVLAKMQEAGEMPADCDFSAVTVEPPREAAHGDLACNAAMVLAGQSGEKPRDLAEKITAYLAGDADIDDIAIAGPGFINIRLQQSVWYRQLREILQTGKDADYGDSRLGKDKKINIEYVSANPTGPMHVGHARGAVVGDVLARLLEKVGYEVCREYYINDAGAQIDTLLQSAWLRMREAQGEDITIPEGLYPGDYLKPIGEKLAARFGDTLKDLPEAEKLEKIRQPVIDMVMNIIRDDLAALGVRHDVFASEYALHEDGTIIDALEYLDKKELAYKGVLPPPKGKDKKGKKSETAVPTDRDAKGVVKKIIRGLVLIYNYPFRTARDIGETEEDTKEPQLIFRATQFGDDRDRVLQKPDGRLTYFAADIAYHYDKYKRGFAEMINIWGADHIGYVKRMQAAVSAITEGQGKLDILICQLVRLVRDGKPVKMSKRAGQFITLRDVVDEVGADAVRFMMLTRRNDAELVFDFTQVKEQSRDNPVFYVQYAHARICSVLRHVIADKILTEAEINDAALADKADFTLLTAETELQLIKFMAGYPRLVEKAAEAHEPHRIAFYLTELAALFHLHWNLGNENPQLKFIQKDKDATLARVALIRAVALVLASGLDILGITPRQEMR